MIRRPPRSTLFPYRRSSDLTLRRLRRPAEHRGHAGALRLAGERAADRGEAEDADLGGAHGLEGSGDAGGRKREGRRHGLPLSHSSRSLLIRLRTAHASAPHTLDCRTTIFASPVTPGRSPATLIATRIRASTTLLRDGSPNARHVRLQRVSRADAREQRRDLAAPHQGGARALERYNHLHRIPPGGPPLATRRSGSGGAIERHDLDLGPVGERV